MSSRPQRPALVLVVDDEPTVLEMMARTIRGAGYTVHPASNGPEALALAEELPELPDLVVTDLQMEPLRGTALAELLFSRGLASRFLFVSGSGRDSEYNEEFGPLLPKPFLPARLLEAVESILS